ncbi:UNC5C-like protein [Myotis brandtii]|uniref:UNC5C-like protein n=1 Tax=Myotis brandtii TaxID=109478 RepID=S7NSF5_MYOBR|nr:UNC5C-like protein [Myotis brandtii]
MEAMLAWSLSRDQWENKSELSPGTQTLRAVLREDFIRPGGAQPLSIRPRSRPAQANENEDCSALTNEIIVTMHTFQDGLETKYMEILRFQASEEESWAAPPPVSQLPPCNRLPPELFEQLKMLLEPNSITGNDWRRLASHLGLCGMKIRFLSCQRSPAAAILELFEEQNGSLQELHYLMTLMERLDCASAIQNYLGSPAQVRVGTWENQDLELELDVKL